LLVCVIVTELRVLRERRGELIPAQAAVVVDVHDDERRTDLLGELLPGHEIRMVFEDGGHDDVARPNVLAAPGLHDQVQTLGRVAAEDDLTGSAAR